MIGEFVFAFFGTWRLGIRANIGIGCRERNREAIGCTVSMGWRRWRYSESSQVELFIRSTRTNSS